MAAPVKRRRRRTIKQMTYGVEPTTGVVENMQIDHDDEPETESPESAQPEASQAEIDVDIPKQHAKSLADRLKSALLGGNKADDDEDEPPEKRKALSVKRTGDLAVQICIFLATILCWISDGLLAEPYKPVGPTQDEAQAITAPVGRMIARRLKKAGKMSEDAIDSFMIMTAVTFYINRARKTHKQINALMMQEVQHASSINAGQAPSATNHSSASNGYPIQTHGRHGGNAGAASHAPDREQSHGDARGPIDPMDALLAADALGRAERGLN